MSEYLFYIVDNDFAHILVSILFLVQLIVSYPNSLRFDGTYIFKSNILKMLILLPFINLIGVFVVLNIPLINNIGVVYHSFFIIASFIFYYFISYYKSKTDFTYIHQFQLGFQIKFVYHNKNSIFNLLW